MSFSFALRITVTSAAAAIFAACAHMLDEGDDIVDFAAGTEEFSIFVAALSTADLVETLRGEGPFTVFAPTNAAFAALPAVTMDTLFLPEKRDQLMSILTYHVVPGVVTSDQLPGQRLDVATVQGDTVRIDATGDAIMVNGANVTAMDIVVTNGVIHVIDAVIAPH